jgi:hypothetical protein
MMINDSKVYYEAGYKAGQAMSRRDVGLYNHMRDWYRKAQRLENDADKTIAGKFGQELLLITEQLYLVLIIGMEIVGRNGINQLVLQILLMSMSQTL